MSGEDAKALCPLQEEGAKADHLVSTPYVEYSSGFATAPAYEARQADEGSAIDQDRRNHAQPIHQS
jgi:hypothetical protein